MVKGSERSWHKVLADEKYSRRFNPLETPMSKLALAGVVAASVTALTVSFFAGKRVGYRNGYAQGAADNSGATAKTAQAA